MSNSAKEIKGLKGLFRIDLFLPQNKSSVPNFRHFFEGEEKQMYQEAEKLKTRYQVEKIEVFLI